MHRRANTLTAVSVVLLFVCASLQIHPGEAKTRFLREVEEGYEGSTSGTGGQTSSPSPLSSPSPSSASSLSPSSLSSAPPSSNPSSTGTCVASTELVGGCMVDGGAGVTVNYKLVGNPPDSVTFLLSARTSGYVAISFTDGHQSMSPADGVIGWMGNSGASVKSYQINSHDVSGITPDSNVPLTNTSASESGGMTTITFTRPLNAGRYPIDPSRATFNVAQGGADSLVEHSQATSGEINLEGGTVVLSNSDRDKFWITHGILMVAAWAFLVPHAIGFARFKGKWSALFRSETMWFHMHRLLQLIALLAHVVSLIIALTKFGDYEEDAAVEVHAAFAWIVTGLLGVQWIVALFLRPDKKAPRRRTWNLAHFSMGRIMLLLALVNIGIGIYLYERKSGILKLSTGAWIGIFVAALATAVIHYIIMMLRKPVPGEPDAATSAIEMPHSKVNPRHGHASEPSSNNGGNETDSM